MLRAHRTGRTGPCRLVTFPAVLLSLLGACGSLSQQLETAHELYDEARYEDAVEWLTELEPEVASMGEGDRAQFYYLRGMTAYRLGQRDDAMHFLALADVAAGRGTELLSQSRRVVLDRTLDELMPQDATPHARAP